MFRARRSVNWEKRSPSCAYSGVGIEAELCAINRARVNVSYGRSKWRILNGPGCVLTAQWLQALKHFRPDIATGTEAAWAGRSVDAPFVRPDKPAFANVSSESIDYAVMERCPASAYPIAMVPLDAGWDDLGAWDAVGVSNLVIVETADAVLVADRSQSQHVKKIVATLEQTKREEITLHHKVHRP